MAAWVIGEWGVWDKSNGTILETLACGVVLGTFSRISVTCCSS